MKKEAAIFADDLFEKGFHFGEPSEARIASIAAKGASYKYKFECHRRKDADSVAGDGTEVDAWDLVFHDDGSILEVRYSGEPGNWQVK